MRKRPWLLSWLVGGTVFGSLTIMARLRIVEEANPHFVPRGLDAFYKDELFYGIVYGRYNNGNVKRLTPYWAGKKVLSERIWYDDGMLMILRPYRDGLPHGEWQQWYQNGLVKSMKRYENGVIVGESWGFHQNGQVSDFNFYENGRELTHKSWISDGTPYYNYVYQYGHKIGIRGGEFCKRLDKVRN